MFLPNSTFQLVSTAGTDVYGQQLPGTTVTQPCRLIKAIFKSAKTSPRQQLSASESAAREEQEDLVLLVSPLSSAKLYDVAVVAGYRFTIVDIEPVYSLQAALDHYKLTGAAVVGD